MSDRRAFVLRFRIGADHNAVEVGDVRHADNYVFVTSNSSGFFVRYFVGVFRNFFSDISDQVAYTDNGIAHARYFCRGNVRTVLILRAKDRVLAAMNLYILTGYNVVCSDTRRFYRVVVAEHGAVFRFRG